MKPGVLIAVILILTAACPATGSELEHSFLDIPWGSAPDATRMEKAYTQASIDYYVISDRVFQVGENQLTDILFAYYQNRFFAVHLKIDAPSVFQQIKTYMNDRYGFPETTYTVRREQTIHRWEHGAITMKLKAYELGDAMKLSFYYAPVSKEVNSALGQQEDASVRFFPIERGKRPEALPLLRF